MTDPSCTAPIRVNPAATPIVTAQTFQAIVVAGCALAADKLMHSDLAIAAALPAGAAVATVLWGVWLHLKTWRALKLLANIVPDSVAVVGKPK